MRIENYVARCAAHYGDSLFKNKNKKGSYMGGKLRIALLDDHVSILGKFAFAVVVNAGRPRHNRPPI